ncbi:hypothetical protein JCM6882_004959 [Rhodosporidiobolus microsporus]
MRLLPLLTLATPALAALELFPSGADYPFAVHLPLAPTSSPPPAILFLHGSGSRGGEDALESQTLWDGVGWLVAQAEGNNPGAQQIVAEQYLDDWDPASVLSVLNATTDLASTNSSFAFNASQGSFAVWNTFFTIGYPTPFAALLPCAGTATYSSAQLTNLVSPPSGSSPVSVLGLSSSDDEKQPPENTESAIEALSAAAAQAGTSGNWTTRTVSGFDHKAMSQDAWLDEEMWWWVGNQTQQTGGEEILVSTAVQAVSLTSTSDSPSAASTSRPASATGVVGAASTGAADGGEDGDSNAASRVRPFRWW